jgi:DNA-binding transcriptional MerR regulator
VTVAKGPDAFRTISEAASELGVPQHVLRFWETKFSFIRPMKRAGGRRFYRRQDIDMLRGVRVLLHEEGYTIKGVQRLHKEQGLRRLMAAAGGEATPALIESAPIETSPIESAAFEPSPNAPDAIREAVPVLDEAARTRLSFVLDDLEGVKARIDALLAKG